MSIALPGQQTNTHQAHLREAPGQAIFCQDSNQNCPPPLPRASTRQLNMGPECALSLAGDEDGGNRVQKMRPVRA